MTIKERLTRLHDLCAAGLRWCGNLFMRVRDFFSPLTDLRIMLIVLTLGGVLLLFVDAGEDVIRQLVGSANATDYQLSSDNVPILLRWFLFLFACVWTGVNAWYWAHFLYKTKLDAVGEQPRWFTWLRRFLGVLPLIFAVIAMFLSARHLEDNLLPMAFFAACAGLLLWFFVKRNDLTVFLTKNKWKLAAAAAPADPAGPSRGVNTVARGDYWFAWFTSILSAIALLVFSTPILRTYAAWAVGPAALTFGAIGGIIALTSWAIYMTRPYQIPIVLIGIWAFVIFSLWNDNHAIRAVDGTAAVKERPSVADAYRAWQGRHTDPEDPLILIASAGGASRAAYWTGTVFRAFDDRTDGKFFDHVFAISSVSGGTLGAIGYAAWLSERSPKLEAGKKAANQRQDFVQNFLGGDYLGPSLAGLLYPDLLQRFFFVSVPLVDRARSLEEAFEMGWNSSMADCRKSADASASSTAPVTGSASSPACGARADRFSQEFIGLWANSALKNKDGRWVPLVLANGTHVETGKRIITAPVRIDHEAFEDVYDFYALNEAVRASTAVLNSARFTLVSPPGRMTSADGQAKGGIIDGGYFENGALETLYDLARFIRTLEAGRKIIIIEILNDDTMNKEDLSRHPPAALDVAKPPKLHWYSGLLSELTSIIGGLYETRSSRGIVGAKRLSNLTESNFANADFVSFDLQPFGHDCQPALNWIKTHVTKAEPDSDCHTAMSWALSLGSRDAMDVSFNMTADKLDDFFAVRHYRQTTLQEQKADLQVVIDAANAPGGYNDRLNLVLKKLENKGVAIQAAPAPTAAPKRN